MGKYDDIDADENGNALRRRIANELAEANRLKRIEITWTIKQNQKDSSKNDIIEDLLKDQA